MIEYQEEAAKICRHVYKVGKYEGEIIWDYREFKSIRSAIYRLGMYTVKQNGEKFMVRKRNNFSAVLRKTIHSPGTYEFEGDYHIANTYMSREWPNWEYKIIVEDGNKFKIVFGEYLGALKSKIRSLDQKSLEEIYELCRKLL